MTFPRQIDEASNRTQSKSPDIYISSLSMASTTDFGL